MASDNPQAAGGSSRRSRTPPTLDLTAEEVRAEAAGDSVPATDAAAEPAKGEPLATAGGEAAVQPVSETPSSETPSSETLSPEASSPGKPESEAAVSAPEAAVSGTPGLDTAGAASPAADSPASTARASQPLPPGAAAEPRRGSGAGTVFAALVLGALAGGAAGGGVLYYAAQHQAPPAVVDMSPLTARIAVLEARPVADPAALAALRQGLSQADARFRDLDAALAALKAASASAASAAAGAPAPNVDALKAALAKIEAAQAKTEASLARTDAAVGDVNARVAALKTAQDAVQAAVGAAAATATATAQQAQVLGPRLDALTTHVETVRKQAADAAAASSAVNRTAAALLVLGTLKQAVDAGRPFAAELDAARALVGARVAALDPFAAVAATGFPELPKLADRLAVAGNAAIDGLAPPVEAPAPDATLVTRFLASAQTLVKVRPAGSEDPESLRGTLNRAVAAVRAGDLASALATLKQLPAPVQEKLATVAGEIDVRRRAAEAAATLYQQALAAVSGKAP
ncbi:hypothetical protein V5F53_09430 [Xanthobacter sp. V4C-4]|uniref:hypothetical protein n=1 Tax=Xanthobacter cornucopiae TaxID=3119924 RepID=UPI00372679AD